MNGAVPTWKLYWCVLTERNSCLWLPPGDMAVRVLLECVSFLGRWSYITTGTLSAYQSRGGGGGQLPTGTVEPDKSSLWMDLFPLDWVILIVVTCICFQFSRGRIQTPPPPYKARTFDSCDNAAPLPTSLLVAKKLATALLTCLKENLQRPSSLTIRKS